MNVVRYILVGARYLYLEVFKYIPKQPSVISGFILDQIIISESPRRITEILPMWVKIANILSNGVEEAFE